ncbi:PREDICTED: methyl-CpG-binding domain-containing protein 9-like [Erythranthe guttata]|uniref:methyl-CpG-binding domain-containing protein 9-like n=1 Tax=Erythranthe guttata TaxID=4155 RepID=UPI00064D7F53|nr:PREDICTED: methyl-CpG-binding domain-containing protein 9-like [Erythranthe guttata]|eukprot:XP_012850772.1 PREDICTED: methyl-CpG-binding domain-containing protein 9-like [Erythranthe guttata]
MLVLPLQHKLDNSNEDIDHFDAVANEIPKAPWDKGICKVCGIDEEDNKVLLCDQCDAEYHTYCLNPPLAGVPRGSWHCLNCVAADANVVQDALSSEVSVGLKPEEQKSDLCPVQYKAADVVDEMREKEYSELTSDERILLLNFFCNEMLDSDLIREHLKKCELYSSQHPIESGTAMHTTIESASFKNSLRSEFLGIDYTGTLYWMIDSDTGTWVIVNGVDELYQDSKNSKVAENSKTSRIEQLWSIGGSKAYSSWACYQSEDEIKRVVNFLRDDDRVKGQLEKAFLLIRSRINDSPDEFKIEGEESQPLVLNQGPKFMTRMTNILKGKGNYAPSVEGETTEMKMKRIKGKMVVEDTDEVDPNSRQQLVDKTTDYLGQLKVNLLDMEAAIPKKALRSSKACIYRRHAWRVFVKRSNTIFEVVQALIVFEDMIKLSYLDCSWRYWSSLPTAAQISTLSALSLRIYSLDSAIKYDNSSSRPS